MLDEFNIKAIEHIAGKKNIVADMLSRYHRWIVHSKPIGTLPSVNIKALELQKQAYALAINCHDYLKPDGNEASDIYVTKLLEHKFWKFLTNALQEQKNDEEIMTAYQSRTNNRVVLGGTSYDQDPMFFLIGRDGRERIYVPVKYRDDCIAYYHRDAQHPGIDKTVVIIKRYLDWPGMRTDVTEYVSLCHECKTSKRRNWTPYGTMKNVVSLEKNYLLAIDYFGPLPTGRGGVQKIIVCMDVFTKFVKLFAVKSATTEKTIEKMKIWTEEFGVPKNILSDNGSQFTSSKWLDFWNKQETLVRFTSVYRPASNPVERVMQTISECLRLNLKNTTHGKWPLLLEIVERKINCVEHTVTGFPPITLQYGLFPRIDGVTQLYTRMYHLNELEYNSCLKKARERIKRKLEQRRRYFERTHPDPISLQPGDIVYAKTHYLSDKSKGIAKKLKDYFRGPVEVIANAGDNCYVLRDLDTEEEFQENLNNIRF